MKKPSKSSSSWSQVVFAAFVWASLVAWSEATDLAEAHRALLRRLADALRGAIDKLIREAHEEQERSLLERPAALAKRNAKLTALGRAVADAVSTVAKGVGGRSKDHPAVRKFLPQLAAGISSAPASRRPSLTIEAAGRLESMAETFPEKEATVARLREAAQVAQEAIDATGTALTGLAKERSEEVAAKHDLRIAIDQTWGVLNAEFPGQRAFVESFFPKPRQVPVDDAEASEPETAPSPPPAPHS